MAAGYMKNLYFLIDFVDFDLNVMWTEWKTWRKTVTVSLPIFTGF